MKNYYQGQELKTYQHWIFKNFRPRFIESLQFPEGKIMESIEIFDRGKAIFKYLEDAKEAERKLYLLENHG